MAPTAAGGRELPHYMLDGVPPYLTLSPSTGGRRRSWCQETGGAPAADGSDHALELAEFTARPDQALSVCPLSYTHWQPAPQPAATSLGENGTGTGGKTHLENGTSQEEDVTGTGGPPRLESGTSLEEDVTGTGGPPLQEDGTSTVRTDPDGEAPRLQRSISLTQVTSV